MQGISSIGCQQSWEYHKRQCCKIAILKSSLKFAFVLILSLFSKANNKSKISWLKETKKVNREL